MYLQCGKLQAIMLDVVAVESRASDHMHQLHSVTATPTVRLMLCAQAAAVSVW